MQPVQPQMPVPEIDLTPAQYRLRTAKGILTITFLCIFAVIALWVIFGLWEWVSTTPDTFLNNIVEATYWFLGIGIVSAIVSFILHHVAHDMRQKELAAEKAEARSDLNESRNYEAYLAELTLGHGPQARQKMGTELDAQMTRLTAALNTSIILKREEANISRGAAKRQVEDELTLMQGLKAQIVELNKIAATDPELGEQVWGEWQKQKPDRPRNF